MKVNLVLFLSMLLSATATCAVVSAAPLDSYWRLNETSTADPAVEATGNLAAGTYGAGVDPTVAGPFAGFGTAANFDGASDINVGGGTAINFTNNFSTSAWVNFDNFSGKHTYLGSNAWGVRNLGNGSGTPHITTFGVKDYVGDAGELTAGTWHHVVTVLDSNNDVTFYVDGAPAGTDTHTSPGNANTGAFAIGAVGPGGGEKMVGSVDDVGVFSTALSATEVAAIYNLAIESALEYDLGESNALLEAFANGDPTVDIDGVTWEAVSGLSGAEGELVDLGDDRFAINLGNGSGFQVAAVVPEPMSIAIWSLTSLVAAAFAISRKRRR